MGKLRKGSSIILILSIVLIAGLSAVFFRESEKESVVVSDPVFSYESGMYENNIQLTITAGGGTEVYYTLDGSEPDINSIKYTGPIEIDDVSKTDNKWSDMDTGLITGRKIYNKPIMKVDKCTIIRAVAITPDGVSSNVITKSYFIGKINNSRYNNLPIISLISNPYNLFDYNAGIYVLGKTYDDFMAENPGTQFDGSIPANYNRRGIKWERKSYIEYFDSQGNVQVSQDIGLRIQGAFSRFNMQKSFSLYAREEYGKDTVDYKFFGDTEQSSFSRLVLQNIEETKYIDPYVSNVTKELDVDTITSYQPVIVFLDGEYWGVYTIRQAVSVDYLSRKYSIDADDILMAKADGYGSYNIESGRARDIGYFNKMINYAETQDMTVKENYEKINEMMDMQSFIDWISIETYLGNFDCIKPGRPDNNVIVWRVMVPDGSNEYADGKWRWILFDTDKGGGYQNDYTYNDLQERLLNQNDASHMQRLFRNLVVNDEFRQMFIDTFRKMGSTVFNQSAATMKWSEFSTVYNDMLERYYARFPTRFFGLQKSLERVKAIDDYFMYRPLYVENMIQSLERYIQSNGGSANE